MQVALGAAYRFCQCGVFCPGGVSDFVTGVPANSTRLNEDVLKHPRFNVSCLLVLLWSAVQIDTRYTQHVCVLATLISITVYKLTPTSNILANSDY